MSEPRRQIILVHGRSTKPSAHEKRRLVRIALRNGVRRTSEEAFGLLRDGQVSVTLAYYGDISNRVIARKGSDFLTAHDPEHDWAPCEPDGYYDAAMARSMSRPTRAFTAEDYGLLLKQERDARLVDEVAAIASRLAGVLGLNEVLVRHSSPDSLAYFTEPEIGEAIRERVATPILDALRAGRQICLICHSMGCVVAYDVLWRISRMPEYQLAADPPPALVDLWLTLGNPLGEPGVRANLLDAKELPDDRFPRRILHNWINLSAEDDYIAHDKTVADDYREMLELGYLHRLVDRPPIYNFWVQGKRSNPHKLYGYLDHPAVGGEIARWILGQKPTDPDPELMD
ncbi:MAG: hypothetical protein R3F33_01610 [Planctomycetota bacterium]